ncbi:tyrosine-type recombinase/integrase [Acetobacter sp.]|uniref:tyrosine-type recombinase/integrase n=1 Tax=Acetobacter sp. TaxID=440 RepID=UPI0039EB7E29
MVSGDRSRSPAKKTPVAHNISADDMLIRSWLHNRSDNTRDAYERDARAFLAFTDKLLAEVVLADLQAWFDSLECADATRRRKLAAVKSLLSFGARLGMLASDVGAAFRMERGRDTLHERILTQEEVAALIEGEDEPRKRAFLRVLYVMGLRLREACGLTWRSMTRRQQGGIATVHGKGGKTRSVLVPTRLWKELVALRVDNRPDAPVVPGHDGGPLHAKAADRIVKRAVKRAGLSPAVSAHWLRHACASHAQDRGAPPHVVQATLGHASLATTTRYSHVREGDGAGKYLDL